MKIVFIGAGNMAEAIVAGILKQGIVTTDELCVTDIAEARLTHFVDTYHITTSSDNRAAVSAADVIVLAVKPQIFPEVWPEIESVLKPESLVISIMAGVPSKAIAGNQSIRVVRVMPNTPALVGQGAAGIAAGEHATEADIELACRLMRSVGVAVVVPETDIDAVTALSGSGPAYVFYLLESMLAAAERMGLEKELSRELALATVIGAARLMQETGEDADALRKKVTSKGGTTAAAIDTMEERGVRDSIIAALLAAQSRSKELADG